MLRQHFQTSNSIFLLLFVLKDWGGPQEYGSSARSSWQASAKGQSLQEGCRGSCKYLTNYHTFDDKSYYSVKALISELLILLHRRNKQTQILASSGKSSMNLMKQKKELTLQSHKSINCVPKVAMLVLRSVLKKTDISLWSILIQTN